MFLKSIYALLIIALLGYWAVYFIKKSNNTTITNKTEIPGTTIAIDNNIRNLGKVNSRKPLTTKFIVRNTGKSPLLIYDIAADCKCTVPTWEKNPIKPGDSTVVRVTYDAHVPGFFAKKALIKYNSFEGDFIVMMQGEIL